MKIACAVDEIRRLAPDEVKATLDKDNLIKHKVAEQAFYLTLPIKVSRLLYNRGT